MPTNEERIIAYLKVHPEGAEDGQLSSWLNVKPHAQVNQICRRLHRQGLVSRLNGESAGNIVNRWIGNGKGDAKSVKKAALERSAVRIAPIVPVIKPGAFDVRLVQLAGDDIDSFSYLGELKITEDQVKAAVSQALREERWTTDVRWGHVHGIDIHAERNGRRLIVEAKGEGSRSAMRVNFFVGALGELIQRMDSLDNEYALAFPAHRQYIGLISRLPLWGRSHLKLQFYLVRPGSDDSYEVGVVKSSGQ